MSAHHEIQRIRLNRNAWRTSMTKEILHLEDNLDQIYNIVGLKPHRIVREDDEEQGAIEGKLESLNPTDLRDYDSVIDDHIDEIRQAVDNICGLISAVTEFELPIPVLVLLKVANRISSIRCPDFKKKVPGTLSKKYVLIKRSLDLISIGLFFHEWISMILSTNILPFQANTNQHLMNLLAWTRTSNLREHDQHRYYAIRLQIITAITKMVEMFSINLNLDPVQLSSLIDDELISSLSETFASQPTTIVAQKYDHLAADPLAQNGHANQAGRNDRMNQAKETLETKYICASLVCLDKLFVAYADNLGAKLEVKLKNFVIQTCIKIYRDFDRNTIELPCRIELMRLLENIANRPFATSTTELAWHIFELCDKMESDQKLRYIANRSIKMGLAHRPVIVSHFDVYDCSANLCSIENGDEQQNIENSHKLHSNEDGHELPSIENSHELPSIENSHELPSTENSHEQQDIEDIENSDKQANIVVDGDDDDDDDSEDDEDGQAKPYLDLFVDSPVTNVGQPNGKE